MEKSTDVSFPKRAFRENLPLALELKKVIWKYAEAVREEEKCETIKIMNFCGTHEWTTTRYGVRGLLPPFLEMVAGPGCPVCVTPSRYVDVSIKLAQEGVRVYTYGDAFRLRSTRLDHPSSLEEVKSDGGDVRVVYSFLDAVRDSGTSGRESVFFGIGFETTAPSYALALKGEMVPENLKLLSAVRLTPPVMKYTIKLYQERGLLPIRGIIAPGHVSTIIGASEWKFLSEEHGIPTVVAGFEPIDLLMAVAQILQMLKERRPATEIEYKRLVSWEGNTYAKKAIEEVFERTRADWRGIGLVPDSGLGLKGKFFDRHDALKNFGLSDIKTGVPVEQDLPPECRCGEVILGITKPSDCQMFMSGCSPLRPWGPCMVSSEGTCNIWARGGGAGQVKSSEVKEGG